MRFTRVSLFTLPPRADHRPLILCLSRRSDSAGGNYDSRFDVGKASGTLIVARPLDAEQKSNYNLTVEATDGTRTVSTQVIEALMKRRRWRGRRPRLAASESGSNGWSALFVGMCWCGDDIPAVTRQEMTGCHAEVSSEWEL